MGRVCYYLMHELEMYRVQYAASTLDVTKVSLMHPESQIFIRTVHYTVIKTFLVDHMNHY